MTKTESRMLELGTEAPDFSLPDAYGRMHSLSDASDAAAFLIMFICNHCPFVKHVRGQLAAIGRDYGPRDVAIFAINSNDASAWPDDSPEMMRKEIVKQDYMFPYLVDDDQAVAHAYQAACTPDFFVFDWERRLTYRGQLDDSRPSNDAPVNGADLRAALDATIEDEPVSATQKPSIGCNIKWNPGNTPDWFG